MPRFPAAPLSVVAALVALVGLPAATASCAPCAQADPIERHYCELGGSGGVLGAPVGAQYNAGAGLGQAYERGRILWSSTTGAHEVHGAIVATYDRFGGPLGVLGFPTTDESVTPDGIGRYNHFSAPASIYWTRGTGAHEVHGAIRREWAALGWERSVLRYPTTDESVTPDGIGRYNHFSAPASIYWTRGTGAHEVHGAIRAKWAALGWERSALGYPITDEFAANGDRQSDFQRGFLRWNSGPLRAVRVALLDSYGRAGTWVSRFTFSREFGGSSPPVAPAAVDAMAAAGVHVLYIQTAADDPRYPGLLSPDLLAAFLTRAHAHGMKVVAWYLPHFTNVSADVARLRATVNFRASGQGFDGVGLDIEDTTSVTDTPTRNARLLSESQQLRDMAPNLTLAAIVLPPVATDVVNTKYWPDFPWRTLAGMYQVWMPMAYWTNRTEPQWSQYRDAARYTSENISRTRGNLGESCAAVSVIGGQAEKATASEYTAMAGAAASQGAVGVSIWHWAATPSSAWAGVRSYAVRGC